MKAGFIGAGKVGFSLGKYLSMHGVALSGYYSRRVASAREAAEFTASGVYEDLAEIVRDSDTLFITVPDGVIGEVWDDMCNLPIKGKNICHCSGSISSAVFFRAEELGAYSYSIHPLYAVSDRYNAYKELGKAYFAIEGSPQHLEEISEIFRNAGNPVVNIDGQVKTLYHAAAVMVSNQMAALADLGAELLTACGFDRKSAEAALGPLIEGNAAKIAAVGPAEALTGPVERNDVATVRNHLEALQELDPSTAQIYRQLSARLVQIAKRKHPERTYEELEKELEK